jgi:hypothetical protein
VIAEGGSVASNHGGFDPLGRALGICQDRNYACGVYAVDDRVVWQPASTGARERVYTIAAKAGQTTTVDFSYRLNPDCSPRSLAKFRVVQQPKHGRVDIGQKVDLPRFPANSPFVVCNKNPVQGVAITYTPATGFAGDDAFAFAESGAGGVETVFRMSLTIK